MNARLRVLGVVALGGVLGAPARYGLARALPVRPGEVPWATLWTNLAGSFLLGLVLAALAARLPTHRYARRFLAGGVLGSFTTMSTFQVETALLLRGGHPALAAGYVAASVAGGLVLAATGLALGRRVSRPRVVAR